MSRHPMSPWRPVGVREKYTAIDETGQNNHRSEFLIREALWLGNVRGKRASLITYFDEKENYIWEILIEFDMTDRRKYDIYGAQSNDYIIESATLFYDKQNLKSAFEKFHQKFLEDSTAMTYAVFDNIDSEKFKCERSSFEKKGEIPTNFKFSDIY